MKEWMEKTAPWFLVPILLMYGLFIILLSVNSFATYMVEKKRIVDKILNVLSGGGAIAFIIGVIYMIVVSVSLMINKIFNV